MPAADFRFSSGGDPAHNFTTGFQLTAFSVPFVQLKNMCKSTFNQQLAGRKESF